MPQINESLPFPCGIRFAFPREEIAMANVGDTFKPGDKVPNSGIYDVIHAYTHADWNPISFVQLME